jgi:hypothetical protein
MIFTEKDLTIVLRHINERTWEQARNLVPKDVELKIINIPNHLKAVTETFRLGAVSGKKLLLALDADVFLERDSVQKIIREYQDKTCQESRIFWIDFLVKDKFRGRIYAGCSLYDNRFTEKLFIKMNSLQYSPEVRRNESSNVRRFVSEEGLKNIGSKIIVGTHDYEQYYSHLFIKYHNRAMRDHKSYSKIQEMILKKQQVNPNDFDYIVALEGFNYGYQEYNRTSKIRMLGQVSDFPNFQELYAKWGITEKGPLNV